MTHASLPVLVAGGGIGGLAAARGRTRERFYDAIERLYGWRVENCLAR